MWDQGSEPRDQGSLPWDQESERKNWDQSNFLKIETQLYAKQCVNCNWFDLSQFYL